MGKIIRLGIFALLLYVAYTSGLPWLQQRLHQDDGGGDAGAPDGAASRCVRLAQRADDSFGDRVGSLSGPGSDVEAWNDFAGEVDRQIDEARTQCACDGRACELARDAMAELGELLAAFGERVRTGAGMAGNPVDQQLRIHDLLAEAQSLASSGK